MFGSAPFGSIPFAAQATGQLVSVSQALAAVLDLSGTRAATKYVTQSIGVVDDFDGEVSSERAISQSLASILGISATSKANDIVSETLSGVLDQSGSRGLGVSINQEIAGAILGISGERSKTVNVSQALAAIASFSGILILSATRSAALQATCSWAGIVSLVVRPSTTLASVVNLAPTPRSLGTSHGSLIFSPDIDSADTLQAIASGSFAQIEGLAASSLSNATASATLATSADEGTLAGKLFSLTENLPSVRMAIIALAFVASALIPDPSLTLISREKRIRTLKSNFDRIRSLVGRERRTRTLSRKDTK